jgi:hypothetical protein
MLPFLNRFIGSKLMTEFNIKFSYIKIFSLVIFHIFIPFLVLNAIVVHASLLWSHLIVLLIILASKSRIGLFILLLLLCGTVFLLTCVIFHFTLRLLKQSYFTCIFSFSFCFSKKSNLISSPFLFLLSLTA